MDHIVQLIHMTILIAVHHNLLCEPSYDEFMCLCVYIMIVSYQGSAISWAKNS